VDFVLALVGLALLAVSFVRLAGPFREVVGGGNHSEPCLRCSRVEGHSHWVNGWLRGWMKRPRRALTAQDWLPHTGVLWPVTLVLIFGFVAAVLLLSGAQVTWSLALLATGGAAAAVLAGLHVARPSSR
jgi:hypothetical protein